MKKTRVLLFQNEEEINDFNRIPIRHKSSFGKEHNKDTPLKKLNVAYFFSSILDITMALLLPYDGNCASGVTLNPKILPKTPNTN